MINYMNLFCHNLTSHITSFCSSPFLPSPLKLISFTCCSQTEHRQTNHSSLYYDDKTYINFFFFDTGIWDCSRLCWGKTFIHALIVGKMSTTSMGRAKKKTLSELFSLWMLCCSILHDTTQADQLWLLTFWELLLPAWGLLERRRDPD